MGLLKVLFGRTPKLDDPAPEIVTGPTITVSWTEALETAATLAEEAPTEPAHPTTNSPAERRFGQFWANVETRTIAPLYCAIDYADAEGARSRRRITIRKIAHDAGRVWISGYCHERRAPRRFRLDRIGFFITPDGEAIEPAVFLRDMCGFAIPGSKLPSGWADRKHIDIDYFDHIAPALILLVAASRSDAHVHNEEVDAIQLYCEKEAFALHRAGQLDAPPSLEQFELMAGRIHAMRPVAEDIAEAIIATLDWDATAFDRLGMAITQVIYADGVVHELERGFLADLQALRRQNSQTRHDGVWAFVDRDRA